MDHIMIKQAKNLSGTELETLSHIWEDAVRATHLFLSEEHILALLPNVKAGIPEIPQLYMAENQSGEILAFMGIEYQKIEELFVKPEFFGRGIGKSLVKYAIDNLSAKYVDVNEQNPQAVGFYKHLGFEVINRSKTDGQGNPFPLLNMKLYLVKQTEGGIEC